MFHDIKYTVAENIGRDSKDIKNRKLDADKEWLDCFKPRSPYDMLAHSAIKSKKALGLGNYFTMNDFSEELNKPVINKFPRKRIIVNYIDEIHSCDLEDMVKYSRMKKVINIYLQILMFLVNIHGHFLLNLKKFQILNHVFKKFLKKENLNLYGVIKKAHFSVKKC